MLSALVYCRVSSASQEDGSSLQSQASACSDHAASLGFTVTRIAKEVYSGAYLYDRPVLSEVRDEIQRGRYNAVIVHSVDRLSRNVAHLHILKEEFDRYNVALYFATEDFDSSAEGKLLQSVKGYVAEVEREKIRERTMRGRRTKALDGTVSYGRKLFGYQINDAGVRVPCPVESQVVKGMFEHLAAGGSLRSLADDLTSRSVLTPKGKTTWWAHSIQSIVRNPAYIGKPVMFRYQHKVFYEDGRQKHNGSVQSDPKSWVTLPEHLSPPLVSEGVFNEVQAVLDHNRKAKRRTAVKQFLLRGMVNCGICGRLMSPRMQGQSIIYTCTSKQSPSLNCGVRGLNGRKAEAVVWDYVTMLLKDPDKLAAISEVKRDAPDTAGTQRQIAKLTNDISTLVTRAEQVDDVTWSLFQQRIAGKRAEIERLEFTLNVPDVPRRAVGLLTQLDRLDLAAFDDRVAAVSALVDQITWNGKDLNIKILKEVYYCKSDTF